MASGKYDNVVAAMAAQMGKTDLELDCIGHRLDQRPAPILYVGPTRDFVTDQFEPRLTALLDEAKTLKLKVGRGKKVKKTRKMVAGVPVRLAHGGSSAALKSDPAALAFVDEYDEMLANIKGQGDPLGLVKARGDTYADFVTVVTSTPSQGLIETEVDPVSGLEFWKVADPNDIKSGIWKLFQEGTRYHWVWPCKHCREYFVPRFSCLDYPKGATPAQARRNTTLICPHCGGVHHDSDKELMNDAGTYIAPGQTINRNGYVEGAPPDSSTCSFWVSGLASPFRTWGERVERYLQAVATGEDDKVQTAINAGFGECFALGAGGEIPEWEEVKAKCLPYRIGEVPREVLRVTAGIDVQKRSLYWVIRGWGASGSSWLLDFGQLYGPTNEDDVWDQLARMLMTPLQDGLLIERAFVDSGFRPDKPEAGDMHRVYRFCRDYSWLAYATKGHDTQTTPVRSAQIEVKEDGAKKAPHSLMLMHLNSDHFKSEVHSRVRLQPGKPGSFHLPTFASDGAPNGITEDYCRQIVSEGRVISPATHKPVWVRRNRANHFLDCEALAAAAAYTLRVQAIPEGAVRDWSDAPIPVPRAAADPDNDEPPPQPPRPTRPAETGVSSLRDRFANKASRLHR